MDPTTTLGQRKEHQDVPDSVADVPITTDTSDDDWCETLRQVAGYKRLTVPDEAVRAVRVVSRTPFDSARAITRELSNEAKPRQAQQVAERIGDAEGRNVDDRLHKIARQIGEDAEARNTVTVVGDLGGIRKDDDEGRYVNDKTHKMPFARLLNYTEYKAHDAGIDVQLLGEYNTSKTCNRCACEGVRETQGRFECGLDDNADKNGALNIGKRAVGKFSKPLSKAGAVLAQPETQVTVHRDDEPLRLVGSTPVGEPYGFRRARVSVTRDTQASSRSRVCHETGRDGSDCRESDFGDPRLTACQWRW